MLTMLAGLGVVVVVGLVWFLVTCVVASIFDPWDNWGAFWCIFGSAFITAWLLWGCWLLGRVVTG